MPNCASALRTESEAAHGDRKATRNCDETDLACQFV